MIVRKERPHPGAQLRITGVDGHRITAFATNTPAGGPGTQLADLELRHRRRAVLHVNSAPWGHLVSNGVHRLRALAGPG